MEKKLILMMFLAIISQILNGCNGSKKGNWSETDKQKFQKDIYAVEELSNFGENKSKWVECYLGKCEANYSSYYEADQDVKGCEKIALECSNEVLSNGSKKGNWSEIDKQKFRKDLSAVEELSNIGENKLKWVECYLSKCEANYSSYYEADQDVKGCENLALECNDEVLSNK
jgi:hypothetical protein